MGPDRSWAFIRLEGLAVRVARAVRQVAVRGTRGSADPKSADRRPGGASRFFWLHGLDRFAPRRASNSTSRRSEIAARSTGVRATLGDARLLGAARQVTITGISRATVDQVCCFT